MAREVSSHEQRRDRFERLWQLVNRRLEAVRRRHRCPADVAEREGPLLEALDAIEFALGTLDVMERENRGSYGNLLVAA